MVRPLIEFVYAQNLPWQRGLRGGARDDVQVKVLSIDWERGDASLILRYPPGWSRDSFEALSAEEEMYVLAGALTINGRTYKEDCYACLPAGYGREGAHSEAGADVLTFFSETPRVMGRRAGLHDPADLVEFIDAVAMEWDSVSRDPALAYMGLRRKVLRWDREHDQQGTYLLASAPHNYPKGWKCAQISHPCVEESFMLAGDLQGIHGNMTRGAYFWRPAGIPHGPFGSHDGSLTLLRFKYGKHRNDWQRNELPFRFGMPYRPAVPHELERFASAAYDGPERY
jgi:hypothetical protein